MTKHTRSSIVATETLIFVCCAGNVMCNRPEEDDSNYITFTDCENCSKECHDCCGEHLDVPDKLMETLPGFYCKKCVSRLPRYLYPKIPKDGITRNIPDQPHHGLSFEKFIKQQKHFQEKKAKQKKNKGKTMKKNSARATKSQSSKKTKLVRGRRKR
jgi:hypothetical protein